MGEKQTLVIAGAGIAGLTAALALSARGFPVVVAERVESLSDIGAGIQIAPNAGRVLADLGLDTTIAAAATEPAAIDVHDGPTGRLIVAIATPEFRKRYGFPYRVIHRADLQSILAAAAVRAGIRVDLGTTVEGYAAEADGLLVRTHKIGRGAELLPAAALIGADGVWSTLRETIAASARPATTGRTAWRAIIPADVARDLVAPNHVGLWLGPDAHLVHYPVARGAAVNLVAIVEGSWNKRGWSAPGDAADLARRFSGWSAAVRGLLATATSWQKFALLELDPTAPWVAGRVALIGDAAHAISPFLAQGAAMAIEDAAVLADALDGAADLPMTLRTYAEARRARVVEVGAASRRTGDVYHFAGARALARNTALRLGGARLVLSRNDWIYRWRAEKAGRVPLPAPDAPA